MDDCGYDVFACCMSLWNGDEADVDAILVVGVWDYVYKTFEEALLAAFVLDYSYVVHLLVSNAVCWQSFP